jgi:general secretion pathway protein K
VIWAIGILALLFATYVGAARYRSIEAKSLAQRVRAEALAEAGISIAVLDLLAGQAAGQAGGPRFGRSAMPFACSAGHGTRLAIAVADEGGKIDLNAASPELIEALLRGIDQGAGSRVAREILAVRETGTAAQRAQGITAGVAQAFRSVLELDQLESIGRPLLTALLPLVTVHSRTTGVDPAVAPADVLRVLSPGGAASRSEARRAMPAAFVVDSPGRTFLISVEAEVEGARASRDAVVEIGADQGHRILEQRDGSLRFAANNEALPPC